MPPSFDTHALRIVPLAGLGEFGMNCLALETRDSILVVDCGASFPRNERGIETVHADFSWLVEHERRVVGVVLTHGHEDHVGGLPYLLGELDVPVYGSPYALGLVRRRLAEFGQSRASAVLHEFRAGDVLRLGGFEVEAVRVSHSIAEASLLCIGTPAGRVVHTGDFNFDPAPPDGEPTNEARLTELGDAGVRLLLSDSTNVDVNHPGRSEAEVAQRLHELVASAPGRVIVSIFSSNAGRLKTLGAVAERTGRRVCLLGRSVCTHVDVASEVGRLAWPSDLLVAPDEIERLPPSRLLVVAAGSQAEPQSTLARIARDEHPHLELRSTDTVILSARIIPGNEPPVFDMLASVLRRGARLHTGLTEPGIHASGHATRPEQERMLRLLRPAAFVPIHGTLHHLTRHAEVARALGVPSVEVVEDGQTLHFDGAGLSRGERVPAGSVSLGPDGEELEPDVLRARAALGRAGVVAVAVPVRERQPAGEPAVQWMGVAGLDETPNAARRLGEVVRETLTRTAGWRSRDFSREQEVRRAVRRRVHEWVGGRPEVVVQFLELSEP